MLNLFVLSALVAISSAKLVPIINSAKTGTGSTSSSNVWGVPSLPLRAAPVEPPEGQRCAGRNYGDRRCCTPENPCDEGEGDCDGPADGGAHDGHAGCKGDLVCGSNNCKQFGLYYHPKDDCCEKPGSQPFIEPAPPLLSADVPALPPAGQRCSGRNYQGRRCCTPENPCNEGEGDCDGPGDGGQHDGNTGCKEGLVCGSNNCRQFGTYFHEKDDCCERQFPQSQPQIDIKSPEFEVFEVQGWSEWEAWSACSRRCGSGTWTRNRYCDGKSCPHTTQSQERPCNTKSCL